MTKFWPKLYNPEQIIEEVILLSFNYDYVQFAEIIGITVHIIQLKKFGMLKATNNNIFHL